FELNTSSKTLYTKGSTKTTLKVTTNLTDKITWKSSNTKVAAVNSKGVVTAKAKGTAVITASCGEYKATCKITVKNPSLKLTKTSATVKAGKTTKISAKATPSGKITYKSSNTKIATVSSKGVVKGKKKGTAKITVTCNGVKKVFTVKVK
ncbi:Ig-like domain-containing protein, partial [Blautia sp.]